MIESMSPNCRSEHGMGILKLQDSTRQVLDASADGSSIVQQITAYMTIRSAESHCSDLPTLISGCSVFRRKSRVFESCCATFERGFKTAVMESAESLPPSIVKEVVSPCRRVMACDTSSACPPTCGKDRPYYLNDYICKNTILLQAFCI